MTNAMKDIIFRLIKVSREVAKEGPNTVNKQRLVILADGIALAMQFEPTELS